MTIQEAERVTPGTCVLYRGKMTEVLSVDRRIPPMIYFRLAGVGGRTSYASVILVPPAWRLPRLAPKPPVPARTRRMRARWSWARTACVTGQVVLLGTARRGATIVGLLLAVPASARERWHAWSQRLAQPEPARHRRPALRPRHSR